MTLSVFYLSSMILYFSNKISVLRLASIPLTKVNSQSEINDSSGKKEKYVELYRQVVLCFENEKPFLSADFSISQLAASLNTNSTYISKTINTFTKMNFNTFVNTYRIQRAKELLDNNELNKYTLVHIYTLSGFKHQSTFNKAFKQIEGIPPTQYLQQTQS
ncbi:helix-turn-helix domain-containing protein [Chryseobacterium sp. T16E-39]|uniref:helix-turn-helix domain-containing protein n=1 Tax=Chryseobacterium sp. T16E-39 TaxID=2015076 RepID=UPI0012FB9886|nr:helix-turn-helix domain-containing protein [Chryseobacterium sp. T16E-39]